MAAVVVAFNGTRVNASDASTNWGNWGSGGGAPASEAQLAYQGTAVNTQVKTTALDGIDYDPGAGAVDMYLSTRRLWFIKVIVSDSFDLNTAEGVRGALGSGNAAYYYYNLAGSGANRSAYDAYPAQGGYLITAIDPRIAAYREGTVGAPDLSAVDWYGVQCAMVVGGAKSENLAMDAIDVGSGLLLTRGDAGSTEGTYQDFVDADQGTDSATAPGRVGVVTSPGPGLVVAHGILVIGESATATEFIDNDSVLLFPDGYHSAGSVGVHYNIENASTVIEDAALMIGQGVKDTDQDTRPDLVVVGSSGSLTLDGKGVRNLRTLQLNDGASYTDGLVQGSGQINPVDADFGGYQTLDGTLDRLITSAAISHTFSNGDAEIICRLNSTDWSPGAARYIFDWDAGTEGYALLVNASDNLVLAVTESSTQRSFTDLTILDNFIDGETYWLRIVYDASVASADFYYSLDPANTPPQDVVWIAGSSPTQTATTPGTVNTTAHIGATSASTLHWIGDISYVSIWDGTVAGGQQVWEADWRTGPDFTGSPAAVPDRIQSVNWEEFGDPVYTQGDDNATAADLDGTRVEGSDSFAALRWDVNTDPDGELDNMTFVKGTPTAHALVLGKDCPSTITLRDIDFIGYNASNGNADSAIYNNSGKAITINVVGGTGVAGATYLNGVGATTTVQATVDYTLTNIRPDTEVTILDRDVSQLDITGTATAVSVGNAAATERQGQSFQVTAAGKAERIRLNLRKVGNPTDGLTVRLVNGVPGSTLLAESVAVLGTDLTTTFVEFDIDLTEKNQLSLATTYGIEIQRTGATDAANYYQVEYSTTSVHGSGTRYVYNASWGTASGDLLFSVMEAASDNELYHVEDEDTGSTTYQHPGTVKTIEVLVMSLAYKALVFLDTLGADAKSVPVQQQRDIVYLNP